MTARVTFPAATALKGPFADEDAVVVVGALEKEEGGEGPPGELRFGGQADPSGALRAGPGGVQDEGT